MSVVQEMLITLIRAAHLLDVLVTDYHISIETSLNKAQLWEPRAFCHFHCLYKDSSHFLASFFMRENRDLFPS